MQFELQNTFIYTYLLWRNLSTFSKTERKAVFDYLIAIFSLNTLVVIVENPVGYLYVLDTENTQSN